MGCNCKRDKAKKETERERKKIFSRLRESIDNNVRKIKKLVDYTYEVVVVDDSEKKEEKD